MNSIFKFLLLIFVVYGYQFQSQTQKFRYQLVPNQMYKIVKVKDGDTVVLFAEDTEITVRLNHIDCPERGQPFGNKAKQFVMQTCLGQKVTLSSHYKYDRYGRLVAEIFLENGENLNKKLVKNGLAWHYLEYSKNKEYAQLEWEARKNKLNIWSEKNPIAPWEWRKQKKKKRNKS